MPMRVSLVRTRWRWRARPDAGRTAPALVPRVRVAVAQPAQAGVRTEARRWTLFGASSTGSFRGFQAHQSSLRPALETGSGSRSRSRRSSRCRGGRETKRLHAWLFFVLGVSVLAKIYDFHLLEWVGHLPAAELVFFPVYRGTRCLVRIRDAGGNRRSGALESGAPDTALSDAPGVRSDRAGRGPERKRPPARDRRGAPDGLAKGRILRRPGDRCRGVRLLARPPLGRGLARRRHRRRTGPALTEVGHVPKEGRSIPDPRMDGPRPSRSGRRAALASARCRRQAVSGHGLCARAAGRPRARRPLCRAVLALRADLLDARSGRSLHG